MQVNQYTTSYQRNTDIAAGLDGDFIVVWDSYGSSGGDSSGSSVQFRRYASNGSPLASQVQVNQYTPFGQRTPAIGLHPSGSFVVVWQSDFSSGSDNDYSIQVRRYASNGVPLASQSQVNQYTTSRQALPAIALDPSGRFIVAWSSLGSSSSDNSSGSIQARRYASDGSPLASQFQVNQYTTSGQERPAIATGPLGSFVLAWQSSGSSGGDTSSYSVQARRFASDGSPLIAQLQVNQYTTESQAAAGVAIGADGNFVVVWQSLGSSGGDTSSESIQARLYASNGSPVSPEFQVNEYTTGSQRLPSVAIDQGGDFVVIWHSQGSPGGDSSAFSIQARRYASDGSPLGSQLQINQYTTNAQVRARADVDRDGDLVVVWDSDGSSGGDTSFTSAQAQRLSADLIFEDGVESGDVSAWGSASTDGGDLSATPGAALAGAFGLAALIDDTVALFVQDDSPVAESRYRGRFLLDPNGYTPGADGERLKLFQLFSATPEQRRLVTVVLRVQGGGYRVLAKVRSDDDTLVNTGFVDITDAPHLVEVDWRRATAPGMDDGSLAFRIDGVVVTTLGGLDNDTRPAEYVRFGTLGIKPGTAGTIYLDAFDSRRR